jgi:hypothetical protein
MKWVSLLAAAAVVGNAASQPSCTYGGIDYSALTNFNDDYTVNSDFYQNYEFVFNVCKQLTWTNGDCVTGSGVCERLSGTKTATDIYGTFVSAQWDTDMTGEYFPGNMEAHYIAYTGQTCMFGGSMTSRIYHVCASSATTPYTSVVHESYYDCQVFIALHSQAACAGAGPSPPGPPGPPSPGPSPSPGPPGTPGGQTGEVSGADVGMIVCLIFFLGGGAYFAVGGYLNHKKGEVGYDRVPNKEFWFGLPSLIKDGFEFTKGKIKARMGGSSEGGYTDLR